MDPAVFRSLSLALPVCAAPMFLVSNPRLVIGQCLAGVIGSFPALNARPSEQLDDWLAEVREALAAHDAAHRAGIAAGTVRPAAPFAVNLIVHRSNDRLERDLAACERHRVPIVITSLGARPEINDAVHRWGGLVLHDVTTLEHARKAIDKGADGLIAVAAGAGGHAGRLSPFALLQEIRAWFDGPLLLSGAIATGAAVLAAVAAGADLAYVGSAFIATDEANASDGYKQAIVDAHAADIVCTNLFTGVHGNYLRASIVAAGLDPDRLPESDPSRMDFGAGAAKAWRDLWGSGQGVGAIDAVVPVHERIERLVREYQAARGRIARLP